MVKPINLEREEVSPKGKTNPSCIELLIDNDLKPLFSQGFRKDCLNHIGYDLRLGSEIRLVTRGNIEKLRGNDEIEIYPNETIIVKTQEVLNLPNNVFAVGSPKMSLLIEGLWAHGGKTDPGYNQPLYLGFQNVGSKPCTLQKGQKIFHLTFYRVHGKTPRRYAGRGPGFPTVEKSPLEGNVQLSNEVLEDIKKVEGIKSFRICNQILKLKKTTKILSIIPMIGLLIILATLGLQYFRAMEETAAYLVMLVTAIGSIGVKGLVGLLFDWLSKRFRRD